MTGTWDCREARVALGVYVLGAIDPAERTLVDAHLATCQACRAELAEFAGLPRLLSLVPAADAIALAEGLSADGLLSGDDFPDGLLSGDDFSGDVFSGGDVFAGHRYPGADPLPKLAEVHDLSAARRRRQRLAWAGAAAAVILIGAAFFGGTKLAAPAAPAANSAQHPNGQPNGPWVTVHGGSGQATATVAYQSMGWGIQMDALVTGIPVHVRCQMWVVESDGTRVQVGGWETDAAEGTVWYPASASVPASNVSAFVITLASGQHITVTPA